MSVPTSIVIGFTPFHLLPMREVLKEIEGNVYLFHPIADNPSVDKTRNGLAFLGACDSTRRIRIMKYFSAGRAIHRLMLRNSKVDIYIPHPFNPLSNYAFFHPRSSARYIYQDGILNYHDAPSPLAAFRWRTRQMLRSAAAALPYKFYAGHLSGIDSRPIAGGFFTHPTLIVGAAKFPLLRRISFEAGTRREISGPRGGTLFLDQPIERILDRNLAADVRRRTIHYVNSLGGQVLYKPHYAQGRSMSNDPTWTRLPGELDALPAEWVVRKLGVSNAVSFTSSALANIAMSDSAVTCHATAADMTRIFVNGRATTLSELFLSLGVQVTHLPR